jgi:hypothetical protein
MPTEPEAIATIRAAVRDLSWPAPAPTIMHENVAHDASTHFVKVFVEAYNSRQRTIGTIGNREFTRYGRVLLACHQPLGTGDAIVRAWSEAIKVGLEGRQVDGVTFREHTAPLDKGPSKAWYFFVVSVEFEYHQQR